MIFLLPSLHDPHPPPPLRNGTCFESWFGPLFPPLLVSIPRPCSATPPPRFSVTPSDEEDTFIGADGWLPRCPPNPFQSAGPHRPGACPLRLPSLRPMPPKAPRPESSSGQPAPEETDETAPDAAPRQARHLPPHQGGGGDAASGLTNHRCKTFRGCSEGPKSMSNKLFGQDPTWASIANRVKVPS